MVWGANAKTSKYMKKDLKSLPTYLIKALKSNFGPQIGRGMFSRVFKKEGENFVTIISRDKAKECNAYFGISHPDYPESEILFPCIDFFDYPGENGNNREIIEKVERVAPEYKLYRMKYFGAECPAPGCNKRKSLKSNLSPFQWALYQELRRVMNQAGYFKNNWDRVENYRKLFREMGDNLEKGFPGKGNAYGDIMVNALDQLLNYGDSISFEISPRNISFDSEGNLVLLDVFFFRDDMEK